MTHSPDTATPVLSVESEYVLLPKDATAEMLTEGVLAGTFPWKDVIPPGVDEDKYILAAIYRAMIDAAPAPNPSPAAKGGEAGAVKAILEWYSRTVENCRKLTSDGNAAREALDRDGGSRAKEALAKIAALATLSPQPAYADALLSAAEQKAQGKRCACLGADEWCPCQNTPDRKTAIERREKSRA